MCIVLGLVVIHTVEVWLYAVMYLRIGAPLYFSTASFTTIGYGDIVLEKGWRLFDAVEGANGLLLSAGRRPSDLGDQPHTHPRARLARPEEKR